MFPRDPFDNNSDMTDIKRLLASGNPNSSKFIKSDTQLMFDQSIDKDENKLNVTMDVSDYDTDHIQLSVEMQQNHPYLVAQLKKIDEYSVQSFRNKIPLKKNVDESSAEAKENNGVLTIQFEIVESPEDDNYIDIE